MERNYVVWVNNSRGEAWMAGHFPKLSRRNQFSLVKQGSTRAIIDC
jgi:hypothetical protein